ncbi:MAG: hypothetical protein K9N51_12825 [Candidatus Pacebacteria bacterium]|nr:hypothetical protein [Candidatus Paceibacterota bacterium]
MKIQHTKYIRFAAFVLALAALVSSRDVWWEIDNTESIGLYSRNLLEILVGVAGILLLAMGSLLLAMQNPKGFWIIYLSAVITFAGLHFPGRAPLSYIPFLSFTNEPYKYLLPLAGNTLTIFGLIFLQLSAHRDNNKSPNKTLHRTN